MILIRRFLAIGLATVALGGLVGCATDIQRTDGYLRPASSASVRFYVPESLPITIYRYGTNLKIDDSDREFSKREAGSMLKLIEGQLNARFAEALRQGGVRSGDDLVIAIDVVTLTHDIGPSGGFNVRALYKSPPAGSTVWSFKVLTRRYNTREQAAVEIVERIMREIQSTNMIGPPKK